MATKKATKQAKPAPAPASVAEAWKAGTAKPLTPFQSTDPRLVAARQDAELVSAAGIVNGMDQDTIDARLLATLDGAA